MKQIFIYFNLQSRKVKMEAKEVQKGQATVQTDDFEDEDTDAIFDGLDSIEED